MQPREQVGKDTLWEDYSHAILAKINSTSLHEAMEENGQGTPHALGISKEDGRDIICNCKTLRAGKAGLGRL